MKSGLTFVSRDWYNGTRCVTTRHVVLCVARASDCRDTWLVVVVNKMSRKCCISVAALNLVWTQLEEWPSDKNGKSTVSSPGFAPRDGGKVHVNTFTQRKWATVSSVWHNSSYLCLQTCGFHLDYVPSLIKLCHVSGVALCKEHFNLWLQETKVS